MGAQLQRSYGSAVCDMTQLSLCGSIFLRSFQDFKIGFIPKYFSTDASSIRCFLIPLISLVKKLCSFLTFAIFFIQVSNAMVKGMGHYYPTLRYGFFRKHLHINLIRGSHWKCSIKKVFLKNSQILMENTCTGVFFNKVAGLRPATLLKKELWYKGFPVNFSNFSRSPSRRLLLFYDYSYYIQLAV